MIANLAETDSHRCEQYVFDEVVFAVAANRGKPSRKVQVVAGLVVMVVHAGFWWFLQWASRPQLARNADEDALLIDFIVRAPAPEPSPLANTQHSRLATVPAAPSKPSTRPAPHTPAILPMVATPSLYNDDGSVRLSAQMLADLGKLRGDDRSFDFQQPGLVKAAELLRHESPIEYRATRFDRDWRPDQDLLTELLTKAVEASTTEIRIPIPGDKRAKLVCRVSILAMGGSCGVETNGGYGDILPGHDDPDTLSIEEDRACQAWWEKIITAKTQDEWRSTRKLYEQQCRKPLARE